MMSVLSLLPEDKRRENRKESLESLYSSSSRLNLLNKRKRMNPLTSDMSNQSLSGKGDRYVTQRVLSAKTHRVKQLQNQLSDAHYHLQELSNENRVLRAMQKKQEIALQRYENSNAELPQVLNSHAEEMRIQQTKYKQLKAQFKELTQKLKERDVQYQALKDEHQHLLDLSRDKNLLEREKQQSQLAELTARVQQQADTINVLQRRITLEAKNYKHQLHAEITKHKDTRHDLDLAISNADKLTTIIEMKEKMLNNAASRILRSPTKSSSTGNIRSISRSGKEGAGDRNQDRNVDRNVDHSALGKLCQDSRHLSSSLSHEEELTTSTSTEPTSRSKYATSNITNSASNRTTPNPRKSSKSSDDMIDLAKTVQEGMADLTLYDKDLHIHDTPDEMTKRMEAMKADLLSKIQNNEDPFPRKSSALRKRLTDESVDEDVSEDDDDLKKRKIKGRRNSAVTFYSESSDNKTVAIYDHNTHQIEEVKPKRENSMFETRMSTKSVDKYTKDIIFDIEKSNKVIDKHVKQFNATQFDSEKLVKQLQVVDQLSSFVNSQGEIPSETLSELNNNFEMLSNQVMTEMPSGRKRSIAGRRNSKIESRNNLLGDSNMSNQDLLEDLLGRK